MKYNKILTIVCSILALASCSKQILPYDLEGVERGVIINIAKVEGSSTTLSTDLDEGDYRVELSVPEYFQGDMSMFKEAQLMAVYTDGSKKTTAAHVVEGITSFPAVININIKDACSKLGISEIAVGDRIEFTPCYTLKSGTQIDGWSELTRFNNTRFTWKLEDGSNYSYRVAYTAFAPFIKEHYQGEAVPTSHPQGLTVSVKQIDELPAAEWIPKGVNAEDLVGLQIEGDVWFEPDAIKLWINTQDYTIIFPDQVISPNYTFGAYGTYDGETEDGEGEVDTLNEVLYFSFYSVWGPYSFGTCEFEIYFGEQ